MGALSDSKPKRGSVLLLHRRDTNLGASDAVSENRSTSRRRSKRGFPGHAESLPFQPEEECNSSSSALFVEKRAPC